MEKKFPFTKLEIQIMIDNLQSRIDQIEKSSFGLESFDNEKQILKTLVAKLRQKLEE